VQLGLMLKVQHAAPTVCPHGFFPQRLIDAASLGHSTHDQRWGCLIRRQDRDVTKEEVTGSSPVPPNAVSNAMVVANGERMD